MPERIVCLYADATKAAVDPAYLDGLQKTIGLNAAIFGGSYNLSPATRALNPYPDKTRAPAASLGDDEATLHKAIDAAHRRGMKVWVILGGYHGGAENDHTLGVQDLYGTRVESYPRRPFAQEQNGYTHCPTNERVNAWLEAMYVEVISRFAFDGSALTHFRYCHPAFFEQMLSCACPRCQQKAAELGYDFPTMRSGVLGCIERIKSLTIPQVKQILNGGMGFFDALGWMGGDAAALVNWLNFRADVMMGNLDRFGKAVHAALGSSRTFAFGTDAHYPSMALLVGHRYSDLAKSCGQILPLLSHNEIHFLQNLAGFADVLMGWIPGLAEGDALRLVYRIFSLDESVMPLKLQDLSFGKAPEAEVTQARALESIITAELYKARLYSGPALKTYPVIKGTVWSPEVISRLADVAKDAGHDGIVFQGTDALSLFKP